MIKKTFSLLMVFLLVHLLPAQIPQNYYSTTKGSSGEQLKTKFAAVIASHKNIGYDGLWNAYRTTDCRPDGKVWDMYSSTTNFVFGQDQDKGNHAGEGSKYNREHSFPQSWFGADGKTMKSDIFIVYPTDAYVNNMRSSLAYGETENPTKTSDYGWSKVGPSSIPGYGGTVFEPNDEYKGDFARTYFYIATAYEKSIGTCHGPMTNGTAYPAYKDWVVTMLLRWAKEDPVSTKETDRNNAAYKVQGNRNPYIDFPGLEQYVWGDKTTVSFDPDNYQAEGGGTPTPDPDPNPGPNPGEYDVAAPVFSLTSGEVVSGTEITISCATVGASIFYTINGGELQSQYAPATITVDRNMDVEAYAMLKESKSVAVKASYTVAQIPEYGGTTYSKIYTIDDLTVGSKYLIVCESAATALAGISGWNQDVRGSVSVNIENRTIQTEVAEDKTNESLPYALTLNRDNDGYTLYDEVTQTYLALTDNKNSLPSVNNTQTLGAHWTIDFVSADAAIVNQQYTSRSIRFNSDSPRFSTYENKYGTIALYKEDRQEVPGEQIPVPAFSLPSGEVKAGAQLTLSSAVPQAVICYRVNGGEVVSCTSPVTLTVNEAMTIEAYVQVGEKRSETLTRHYTIAAAPELTEGSFVRVNGVEDLQVGDRYLVVCESQYVAMSVPHGEVKNYREATSVTIQGQVIDIKNPGDVQPCVFVLGGDVSGYTFYDAADNSYLAVKNNENDLNSVAQATDETALWKILFEEGKTLVRNVKFDQRAIKYNIAANRFSTYTGEMAGVVLYKEYVPTLLAPEFSQPSGEVEKGSVVTLACATPGAEIYYQLDGAEWQCATSSVEFTIDGETAISAYSKKNGKLSETVSVKYTVPASTDGEGVFVKVENVADLAAGYRYLVVCEKYETALAEATGKTADVRTVADVTLADRQITTDVSTPGLPYALTLGGNASEGYTWFDAASYVYLAFTGKSNRLPGLAEDNGKDTRWTVNFMEGFAQICSMRDPSRVIMYNNDQPRFVAYTAESQQNPVSLFKETVASAIVCPEMQNGTVDVYSLDGRLLRDDVLRENAVKGLPRGIYVVGGLKLMVR